MPTKVKDSSLNNIVNINTYLENQKEEVSIKKIKTMGKINFTVTKIVYNDEVYNIQFELREDNEITAVGSAGDLVKFYKLEIQSETPHGYLLANNKDGELRFNLKSPKYRLNKCTYRREVSSVIKSHLHLSMDEHIYFYRPMFYLMDESETLEFLKTKRNFENYKSFCESYIKRQQLMHRIFNRPYNLKFNLITMLNLKYLP